MHFTSGFNVLTNGSRESIIIDSINMVLGERTSKDIIIRSNKAVVEAILQIEDESIADEIKSIGVKLDDNMLILHREITQDGRSICRANGQLITTTMLKEIAKT